MNQAHSGRYYDEDFEPKRAIPWMALLFAVLVVAGLCGASLFYGFRDGYERGRAFQASLATPTIPAPAAALTQWSCSPVERREYLAVCAGRLKQEVRR